MKQLSEDEFLKKPVYVYAYAPAAAEWWTDLSVNPVLTDESLNWYTARVIGTSPTLESAGREVAANRIAFKNLSGLVV